MEREQQLYAYEDFTWLPNAMFTSVGYDFLDQPKPRWQAWLLRVFFVFSAGCFEYNVFYLIKRLYERESIGSDARIIMHYSELASFFMNCNVKFLTFLAYRGRVRRLHDELQQIYPQTQQERTAYRVREYFWPIMTRFVLIMYYISAALMTIGPILQSALVYAWQMYKLGATRAQFPYLRAYPMTLGFNSTGFWGYTLTEVVDITCSQFMVQANVGTDLWCVCLAAQIVMHFDFLGRTLAAHAPHRNTEAADCAFLAALAEKHQHIFRLVEELDGMFGVLLIYNLLSTGIQLCCVAIITIVQGINLESLSYLFYFFIASAQFYVVCYYGQLLLTTSENMAHAAYEHTWYNGSIKYKKMVHIIMMRAQKAAVLSANGFMTTSLDTFRDLMNITYRFFALIRQML